MKKIKCKTKNTNEEQLKVRVVKNTFVDARSLRVLISDRANAVMI